MQLIKEIKIKITFSTLVFCSFCLVSSWCNLYLNVVRVGDLINVIYAIISSSFVMNSHYDRVN